MSLFDTLLNHILEVSVTLIAIIWFSRRKRQRLNLPPGPTGVPILGYLPFINVQTIHHDLMRMSERYGSKILYFKFGFDHVAVLNDYESVKETLSRDDMQGRPKNFVIRLFTGKEGNLTTWAGKQWKNQRGFALRSLRNLGFGKSKFEGKIHEEIKYMIDKIDETIEKSGAKKNDANTINETEMLSIKSFLGPAISNTIGIMVTGLRYAYDHPIRKNMDAVFLGDQTGLHFLGLASCFPDLFKIFLLLPTSASKQAKMMFSYLSELFKPMLLERQVAIDAESSEESDNYVDIYLKRLKEIRESVAPTGEEDFFSVDNLYGAVLAIFGAGSSTTKDMLEWFLAFMALHPDAQEDMYQEIMRVIGASRLVSITDKNELPVTEAIIHETLRIASMIPLNLPHVASKDCKIGGYDIPEGTTIIANIYAIHMDEKYWKDPENFRYQRFLSADWTKFVKNDHMIAFGYGRRSCPGESMAILEILLFAVTLIQKYHVTSDGNLQITPTMNGASRIAHPQLKLKLTPR